MKKFLNSNSWAKDANGVRHYDEVDVLAMKYNTLRSKLAGKSYNRFEMVALLSKQLDYYLDFSTLKVLVDFGMLVKPQRGVYQFSTTPVFKTKVYKCLVKMRNNRLN